MSDLTLSEIACLLFAPGHRPDRFDKARAACASGIVLDLEDAVPAAQKDAARAHVAEYLAAGRPGGPVLVRINPLGTRAALDDLAALADGGLAPDAWLLAKVEDPRDIEVLRALDPARRPLLAAVETARGVAAAHAIAARLGRHDALGFGGADYAADLGAEFCWEALYPARTALVQAAAAARIGIFDVPHLDLSDAAALSAETRRVRALGFTGKLAIHPAQVGPVTEAFRPTEDEVARARRIIAALAAAEGGAAQVDGRMIDIPVALAAERTLARAASRP
jgi:citrate lyase beta subunit